jgi:hypothetical protein
LVLVFGKLIGPKTPGQPQLVKAGLLLGAQLDCELEIAVFGRFSTAGATRARTRLRRQAAYQISEAADGVSHSAGPAGDDFDQGAAFAAHAAGNDRFPVFVNDKRRVLVRLSACQTIEPSLVDFPYRRFRDANPTGNLSLRQIAARK